MNLEVAAGPAKDLRVPDLVDAFAAARHPVLFLDYDGTMVDLANEPAQAAPPVPLIDVLRRLGDAPGVRVAVVSGRPRVELEAWLGCITSLSLVAEHGGFARRPGGAWELLAPAGVDRWRQHVLPVLGAVAELVPGSFVEEKERTIAWHYRRAEAVLTSDLRQQIVDVLRDLVAGMDAEVVLGSSVVEVRPTGISKAAAMAWLEGDLPADFHLAAGDDLTDEDLFEVLPAQAWSIHVGVGASRARFRLPSPGATVALLHRLAGARR